MGIKVRLLRLSDIVQVVSGWNTCLLYDRISEEWFENIVFGDPNYEKDGNIVAYHGEKVVGFVAAIAREGIEGRDGRGIILEKDFGYIKGLFVLKEYERGKAKKLLLGQALRFLKAKGKKIAKVGQYTGRYFFPGIDVRYQDELRFYQENGFEAVGEEEDVLLDLESFRPTEYQRQAQRRIEMLGVIIKPYNPEFLEMMRRFVERVNYPQWFPQGWESNFAKKGYTLVALLGTEVVGWALCQPGTDGGSFGPIAVLDELRGKGIGTCLLLESMLHMKASGTPRVTAGWANVPFYLKNGWQIIRRYIVFQRDLTRI